MKKPLTAFFRPLLVALAVGTGYSSWGQVTYSQVPLTASSFNADVVANGAAAAPPTSSTTADVDGTGYYFMSQDYYTATTAHTSGIPNSGLIPNSISGYSALTYQLASLSANNSLRIAGTAVGTGSITFATPTAASEVYVLASSGSGTSTVDMTVNYSDGTTTVFAAQSVPDWFTASATLNVFGMTGRSSTATPVSTPFTAANTAPFFDQIKLTIPAAKTGTTITGISFAKTSAGGYLQVVAVSIGTYPACTAPPTAGTATASATSLCAGGTTTLSLTGVNAAAGLSYQWQSSTTSATAGFTNIAGATSSTYTTAALTQTTYYRAVVTCSGQSANSAVATVTVTAPTYATVPYTQGFENTWLSRCDTDEAPDASWLNTPATGNNSWRRDDDGASANWSAVGSGSYTPAGSNAGGATSLHSARFHNYFVSSGVIGTLDLYVNLSGGTGTPTLKFDYRNSDTNAVAVLLSTDGGVTFSATPLQTLGTAAAWTSYTVNLPSTVTPTTVIRFQATGNFANNDNGIDNVSVSYISCAAATGLAATTTAAGATASASITFTPVTGATTYTFGISPAVTGAPTSVTASPISLTGLAYSTTYTVTLTTNCGSTSAQAATYTFTTPCVAAAYATIPYTQGFEGTWLSRCGTNDVPDNNWANTPVTGNNSWRRNDDVTSAGWTSTTSGAYTPGGSTANGASSTYSARFHSYSATSGATGNFDYYVNLSTAGSKRLTFDYINTSGTDKLVVLLSTNGGATFGATALTTQTTAATWTSVTVDFAATSATSILRFQATSDFGTTDIGLDNVSVNLTPACASPNSVIVTTTGTTTTATFYSPTAANGYTVTTTPATTTYTVAQPATGSATATLTGLTLNTTYTVTATSLCANGSTAATTSAPFLVTPYCNPPHTSGNTGSITNISIASTSFSNATFSTSSTYYTAYPASVVTTTLQQGSTYSFTINLSGTYSTTLWIDYDRNNIFDTGEGVQVIPIAGATTGTASFTVPATATLGATGLRIRTRASGSANGPSDACTSFGSGETQDYVVTIVAPSAIDVQAAALVAPAAGTSTSCYSSTEAVTVTVRNLGTTALNFTTTPLTVTVNVTGAVTQTLTATINTNAANGGNPLASGSTVNITLPTTLNMTTLGTYTFAATATVPGDGNTANDALTPQTRIVAAPVAGTLAASTTSLCISGTTTLTLTGAANGGIQLQSSTNGTTFTDVAGATGTTYTTPVLTATTYYRTQVRCNTGTATSNVSTITVNNPLVATTNTPVAICSGSTATLTATASTGATLRFFDVATGGTALGTGATFTTPALTASKQYFVEANSGSTESVGRSAPASTTNTTASTYGLVFTAASSFTLTSVDVYPTSTAGNLVVQVQDNTGTLIPGLTATVAIPAGTGTTAFTVPLNFNIPAGTGMRLMAISSPSLVRESGIGGFPYTSPSGNVSITSGYISGTSTTYYFFYNWQVSTICVGATRTPIQVNVTPAPVATFSYPATTVCAGTATTLTPTLAAGATAGTYTLPTATGLSINATTGVVTIGATAVAGTYTVTNTVAATGACPATPATATITVNPTPARPTLTPSYNGTVTTLTSSSATGNQYYFNGVAITGATGQTYVVNGSATTYGAYTVVVTNSFGCSSQASVATTVTTTKSSIAGASIQLYPNPTPDGRATLALSGLRSATQLTVIDALGRVVSSELLPATTGVVNHSLDLSRMASGVYMLRLTNTEGVETRRLTRE